MNDCQRNSRVFACLTGSMSFNLHALLTDKFKGLAS
jgi:hypothetical protein